MAFPHMLRLQAGDCAKQDVWWSVQRASPLKSTILHRLSNVVLDYASECRRWLTDHNIPKSNIVVFTGYATSNPHHKPESQPFKTREHLSCHFGSRYRSSHPSR